jgi:hypothetical protein
MHDMIALEGTHNRIFVLQPGILDDRALLAFTGSQCHGLALAMHRRTAWPMVAVDNSSGECIHICVRDPENRLVDVTGAHTDDEMARESKGAIRHASETFIHDLESRHGWVPADIDGCESFVDAVLNRAASETPLSPLRSSTIRVLGPVDNGVQTKVEWSGETYIDAFVSRVPSPAEHWMLYGHLGIPPDPTTGTYEIDFRPERLQQLFDLWMQSQFDRTTAESKLDAPPPSLS